MSQQRDEFLKAITNRIKMGFESPAEIEETIIQWVVDDGLEGEISTDEIHSAIVAEYAVLDLQSQFWQHPTHNERLAQAFRELWLDHKILALHNAGYTTADAEAEIAEAEVVLRQKGLQSEGYCFYHEQDIERAIDSQIGNLFIAFQKVENTDPQVTVAIGECIVEKLRANGLEVVWDGSASKRIEIKPFIWQQIYRKDNNTTSSSTATPHLLPKKFSEISHLLPQDAWARHRDELHDGEFKDEACLLIEGDWDTDILNLDEVYNEQGVSIFLIVVTGNMKAANIYCEETDGATGLIVLGNLSARNMIVGGQEIYVVGNLAVDDCFWGDYNHGNLVVNGSIKIRVLVVTDYGIDITRFDDALTYIFNDGYDDGDGFTREAIAGVFESDCLENEDVIQDFEDEDELFSWGQFLLKSRMIERMQTGLSLVLPMPTAIVREEEVIEEIPFAFADDALTFANVEQIKQLSLFTDESLHVADAEISNRKVEYWKDGIFRRVFFNKNLVSYERIYFQYKTEYAVLIQPEAKKQNMLDKLINKEVTYQLSCLYRQLKGEDTEWHNLTPKHNPPKYADFLQQNWKQLLTDLSEIEYQYQKYRQTITKDRIEQILALPLILEEHSDYYGDTGSLEFKGLQCQFRQAGTKKKCARISIIKFIRPVTTPGKEYEFYHFDLETQADGSILPALNTQDADGYENAVYEIPIWNVEMRKKAMFYFALLSDNIERLNDNYLTEARESKQRNIDETPTTVPFDTVYHNGYEFKVITPHEANVLLEGLSDVEDKKQLYDVFGDRTRFPNGDRNGYFLLADHDAALSHLDLEDTIDGIDDFYILGFIFSRNLSIETYLVSRGMFYSPPIIVNGNLSCGNIYLSGNRHYVGGNITTELLYAEHNSLGDLYVKGKLSATAIVAQDMNCYIRAMYAQVIISNDNIKAIDTFTDADGSSKHVLNYYPDTHALGDVFIPEVLVHEPDPSGLQNIFKFDEDDQEDEDDEDENTLVDKEWANGQLFTFLEEGKSVIDRSKDLKYTHLTPTHIAELFDSVFQHPKLAEGKYMIDHGKIEYFFNSFEYDQQQYRDVGYKNTDAFYKARMLHNVAANTYTAHVEYLDGDDKVIISYDSTLADNYTSTNAARYAMCAAYKQLLEEE